ncbi:alpha/beta hydrolase fold domain-containing protein [Mycolicibacterium chlorophenolicum]|uniref:alpha/beta hydrolase fold domain-containing protein n=1 Tax=Mycolicibacterium chlorophenolicum TaxID=37916 RepID=UPI00103B8EF8|nr:alpha/beta hydrolase [Mycolicibacterium chlorophenolicum]
MNLSQRRPTRAQTPAADTDPSNTRSPDVPADGPTAFTLLALSRRDTEESANAVGRNGVRPPVAERVIATGGSTDPVPADTITAPAVEPPVFTGRPSGLSRTLSAVFGTVGKIGTLVHVDLTIPVLGLLQSDHPPRRTRRGLTVERTEFDGMPVWTMQSTRSTSDEAVVAVHGGALVLQPTVFNWLFYSAMARKTGATVVVPLYPLVPTGTAREVVPAVADLITAQIEQRGADNVSVFGDSSGGNISLVAVQELVRRGEAVPSRMVLSAPAVDSTLSNPAIPLVDDPIFTPEVLEDVRSYTNLWADGLDLADPLLSPLFGSVEGLPPTTIYAGSRDVVAPDILLLRERAAMTPGADFTFVLREGEPHDWAILTILREARAVLPDIYRQLGIA